MQNIFLIVICKLTVMYMVIASGNVQATVDITEKIRNNTTYCSDINETVMENSANVNFYTTETVKIPLREDNLVNNKQVNLYRAGYTDLSAIFQEWRQKIVAQNASSSTKENYIRISENDLNLVNIEEAQYKTKSVPMRDHEVSYPYPFTDYTQPRFCVDFSPLSTYSKPHRRLVRNLKSIAVNYETNFGHERRKSSIARKSPNTFPRGKHRRPSRSSSVGENFSSPDRWNKTVLLPKLLKVSHVVRNTNETKLPLASQTLKLRRILRLSPVPKKRTSFVKKRRKRRVRHRRARNARIKRDDNKKVTAYIDTLRLLDATKTPSVDSVKKHTTHGPAMLIWAPDTSTPTVIQQTTEYSSTPYEESSSRRETHATPKGAGETLLTSTTGRARIITVIITMPPTISEADTDTETTAATTTPLPTTISKTSVATTAVATSTSVASTATTEEARTSPLEPVSETTIELVSMTPIVTTMETVTEETTTITTPLPVTTGEGSMTSIATATESTVTTSLPLTTNETGTTEETITDKSTITTSHAGTAKETTTISVATTIEEKTIDTRSTEESVTTAVKTTTEETSASATPAFTTTTEPYMLPTTTIQTTSPVSTTVSKITTFSPKTKTARPIETSELTTPFETTLKVTKHVTAAKTTEQEYDEETATTTIPLAKTTPKATSTTLSTTKTTVVAKTTKRPSHTTNITTTGKTPTSAESTTSQIPTRATESTITESTAATTETSTTQTPSNATESVSTERPSSTIESTTSTSASVTKSVPPTPTTKVTTEIIVLESTERTTEIIVLGSTVGTTESTAIEGTSPITETSSTEIPSTSTEGATTESLGVTNESTSTRIPSTVTEGATTESLGVTIESTSTRIPSTVTEGGTTESLGVTIESTSTRIPSTVTEGGTTESLGVTIESTSTRIPSTVTEGGTTESLGVTIESTSTRIPSTVTEGAITESTTAESTSSRIPVTLTEGTTIESTAVESTSTQSPPTTIESTITESSSPIDQGTITETPIQITENVTIVTAALTTESSTMSTSLSTTEEVESTVGNTTETASVTTEWPATTTESTTTTGIIPISITTEVTETTVPMGIVNITTETPETTTISSTITTEISEITPISIAVTAETVPINVTVEATQSTTSSEEELTSAITEITITTTEVSPEEGETTSETAVATAIETEFTTLSVTVEYPNITESVTVEEMTESTTIAINTATESIIVPTETTLPTIVATETTESTLPTIATLSVTTETTLYTTSPPPEITMATFATKETIATTEEIVTGSTEETYETETMHHDEYGTEESYDEYQQESTDILTPQWRDYDEENITTGSTMETTEKEIIKIEVTIVTEETNVTTPSVTVPHIVSTEGNQTVTLATESMETEATEEDRFTFTTIVYTLPSTAELTPEFMPVDYLEESENVSKFEDTATTSVLDESPQQEFTTFHLKLTTDQEQKDIRHEGLREELRKKLKELEATEQEILEREKQLQKEEEDWELEKSKLMQDILQRNKQKKGTSCGTITSSGIPLPGHGTTSSFRSPDRATTPAMTTKDMVEQEIRELEKTLSQKEKKIIEKKNNLLERERRLQRDKEEFKKKMEGMEERLEKGEDIEEAFRATATSFEVTTRTTPAFSEQPPTDRTTFEIRESTLAQVKRTTTLRRIITDEAGGDGQDGGCATKVCLDILKKKPPEHISADLVTERVCLPFIPGKFRKKGKDKEKRTKVDELRLKEHEWNEGPVEKDRETQQTETIDNENEERRSLSEWNRFKRRIPVEEKVYPELRVKNVEATKEKAVWQHGNHHYQCIDNCMTTKAMEVSANDYRRRYNRKYKVRDILHVRGDEEEIPFERRGEGNDGQYDFLDQIEEDLIEGENTFPGATASSLDNEMGPISEDEAYPVSGNMGDEVLEEQGRGNLSLSEDDEGDDKKKTRVRTRQTPGPEWPTEALTAFHVGGTRTWTIEYPGQGSSEDEVNFMEDVENMEKQSPDSTACNYVIPNAGEESFESPEGDYNKENGLESPAANYFSKTRDERARNG